MKTKSKIKFSFSQYFIFKQSKRKMVVYFNKFYNSKMNGVINLIDDDDDSNIYTGKMKIVADNLIYTIWLFLKNQWSKPLFIDIIEKKTIHCGYFQSFSLTSIEKQVFKIVTVIKLTFQFQITVNMQSNISTASKELMRQLVGLNKQLITNNIFITNSVNLHALRIDQNGVNIYQKIFFHVGTRTRIILQAINLLFKNLQHMVDSIISELKIQQIAKFCFSPQKKNQNQFQSYKKLGLVQLQNQRFRQYYKQEWNANQLMTDPDIILAKSHQVVRSFQFTQKPFLIQKDLTKGNSNFNAGSFSSLTYIKAQVLLKNTIQGHRNGQNKMKDQPKNQHNKTKIVLQVIRKEATKSAKLRKQAQLSLKNQILFLIVLANSKSPFICNFYFNGSFQTGRDKNNYQTLYSDFHRKNVHDIFYKNDRFAMLDILYFAKQIVIALIDEYQTYNFLHRDLKPDNILLSKGVIQIIDHGSAYPFETYETNLIAENFKKRMDPQLRTTYKISREKFLQNENLAIKYRGFENYKRMNSRHKNFDVYAIGMMLSEIIYMYESNYSPRWMQVSLRNQISSVESHQHKSSNNSIRLARQFTGTKNYLPCSKDESHQIQSFFELEENIIQVKQNFDVIFLQIQKNLNIKIEQSFHELIKFDQSLKFQSCLMFRIHMKQKQQYLRFYFNQNIIADLMQIIQGKPSQNSRTQKRNLCVEKLKAKLIHLFKDHLPISTRVQNLQQKPGNINQYSLCFEIVTAYREVFKVLIFLKINFSASCLVHFKFKIQSSQPQVMKKLPQLKETIKQMQKIKQVNDSFFNFDFSSRKGITIEQKAHYFQLQNMDQFSREIIRKMRISFSICDTIITEFQKLVFKAPFKKLTDKFTFIQPESLALKTYQMLGLNQIQTSKFQHFYIEEGKKHGLLIRSNQVQQKCHPILRNIRFYNSRHMKRQRMTSKDNPRFMGSFSITHRIIDYAQIQETFFNNRKRASKEQQIGLQIIYPNAQGLIQLISKEVKSDGDEKIRSASIASFRNQVEYLQLRGGLKCPYICNYYFEARGKKKVNNEIQQNNLKYIFSDYQALSIWDKFYSRKGQKFTMSDILNFAEQTIKGLTQFYLDHGWLHRDVKQLNILINKQGVIQIIDHGSVYPFKTQRTYRQSKRIQDQSKPFDPALRSSIYVKEKIYNQNPQLYKKYPSFKTYKDVSATHRTFDVFSIGTMLYQMVMTYQQFSNPIWMEVSMRWQELITKMTELDPQKRIEMEDALHYICRLRSFLFEETENV